MSNLGALRRRMLSFAAIVVSLLAISSPTASAEQKEPVHALVFDTFAGISCFYSQGYAYVSYKGWGVDYARNQWIDVYLDVFPPQGRSSADDVTANASTTLQTSGSGSWTSPTYNQGAGGGTGTWSVRVRAYISGSGMLGEAWDYCSYD